MPVYTLADVYHYRETQGLKKLLIDTNLLLLLLIGSCDKKWLSDCDCTKAYNEVDLELTLHIISLFAEDIVITPHILAEVSNMSKRDIKEPKIQAYIASLVSQLKNYREEHVPIDSLLGKDPKSLALFGFPDMTIIEAAQKTNAVILSDDRRLCEYASSLGIHNINFKPVKANYLLTNS